MRTHQQIIREAGHDAIAGATGRPITTVRSWDQRDSIPAGVWHVFVKREWATSDELVMARAA